MHIHNVFNVTLLSAFIPDEIEGRTQEPPPPVTVGEEEEFEVSQVLDSGSVRGKLHYLVRWKGYSQSEDEWLPADRLENAKDAIAKFHKEHPTALKDPSDTTSRPARRRRARR